MSIAKLFVKIFGEDIFEKHTEQKSISQQALTQQDGETKDTKEEVGAADEAAISSVASQKPTPVTRTDDMCLPE